MGELRQNPSSMLDEVESGEVYVLTKHNREVARIVPSSSSATVIPPQRSSGSRTRDLPRIDLPNDMSMDQFLDELKGEW